jgi:hypothetical protein
MSLLLVTRADAPMLAMFCTSALPNTQSLVNTQDWSWCHL